MSRQLRGIEQWVKNARSDKEAESCLRDLIRGAADRAPIDALIQIGQTLVDIRRADLRRELDSN